MPVFELKAAGMNKLGFELKAASMNMAYPPSLLAAFDLKAGSLRLCCTTAGPLTRWSSSCHDKGIIGKQFTGRLDFNQHTLE